jgi:hypothetical protein
MELRPFFCLSYLESAKWDSSLRADFGDSLDRNPMLFVACGREEIPVGFSEDLA